MRARPGGLETTRTGQRRGSGRWLPGRNGEFRAECIIRRPDSQGKENLPNDREQSYVTHPRIDPGWIVGGDVDARAWRGWIGDGRGRRGGPGDRPAGRGKGDAVQGGRAAGQRGHEVARRGGGNRDDSGAWGRRPGYRKALKI